MTRLYFAALSFFLFFAAPLLRAQQVWTKHAAPVLSRSAVFPDWKGLATADAFVMLDNDTLKMWYTGSGWLTGSDACAHVRMGYAWSVNGINWTEYAGNPVLGISTDTSAFDADGIETPCVIKDPAAPPSQRYKLWYAGRKKQCSAVLDHKFGYAYSPDGISWTKYAGNPVMVAGNANSWYNTFISNPSVIKEGPVYNMWFSAPDAVANGQPTDGKVNIGYATSPDGISWTVNPSPVLVAGSQGNWDTVGCAEPSVLKMNGTYHMFYSALNTWSVERFQVGYAFSNDGVNWTKSIQNPVLKVGNNGQWDRYWASHPGVIYDSVNTKFKMWYTGRDTATIGSSINGYFWDIGYAESSFIVSAGSAVLVEPGDVIVYPNPALDKVQLKTMGNPKIISASLCSLLGEKLLVLDTKDQTDLSHFPPGSYLVIITTPFGNMVKKLVKML